MDKDESIESRIDKLLKTMKILENKLQNSKDRILVMENCFTCKTCTKIDVLIRCDNCNKQICHHCNYVMYKTDGGIIHSCKECI